MLGLEDLSAAEKLLAAERKARQDTVKNVDSELVPLLGKLEALEDERAEKCRKALTGRPRDVSRASGAGRERNSGVVHESSAG